MTSTYAGHTLCTDQPLLTDIKDATDCALLLIQQENVATDTEIVALREAANTSAFYWWAIRSIHIVLPHCVMDSGVTDIK